MKVSILRKLRLYMLFFGLLMGVVFPVYAKFFVVWKDGMLVYFVIGCVAAGLTVGVVSYSFVRVILLKPLMKVSGVANSIREKDISNRIELISDDSVGDIVNGINASSENIKAFLLEIRNTTSLNYELLNNIKIQGHNSSAISNINESIQVVTDATKIISEHSSQICYTLENSIGSITDWQDRLEGMNNYITELSNTISSLVKNSDKINAILIKVEDIARRTNMVSVNATIEAASAGVYGKSFSVVANEIRDLSLSVSSSAKDIAGYIKIISGDISGAEGSVNEISTLISKNQDSSKELKMNLDKIDDISHSNYKADKKLVSSVEQLNNSFLSIEEVIGKLSGNTQNLQELLASYKY